MERNVVAMTEDAEGNAKHLLNNSFDRLLNVMAGIASVIIVAAMLNATVGVIMRTFFNRPIGWTSEFNAYALLYITYLSAAWILMHEGHVVISIAAQALKPKYAAALKAITSVIGALVYFLITYFATTVTWKNLINNYPVQATVRIPKFTILIIIPIGCLCMGIQFLRRANKAYKLSKKQD